MIALKKVRDVKNEFMIIILWLHVNLGGGGCMLSYVSFVKAL
jgi:hypothetical protein